MHKLTDDHLAEVEEQGFVIIPGYIEGEKLERLQAAQRRIMPGWDSSEHLACMPGPGVQVAGSNV